MGRSPFQSSLETVRVLVVDPSARVHEQFVEALSDQPCELCFANEGIAALVKIDDWLPNLIFIATHTPRVDGYRLAQIIRANKMHGDAIIVLMSHDADMFDLARGRLARANAHLLHPLTSLALCDSFLRFQDDI